MASVPRQRAVQLDVGEDLHSCLQSAGSHAAFRHYSMRRPVPCTLLAFPSREDSAGVAPAASGLVPAALQPAARLGPGTSVEPDTFESAASGAPAGRVSASPGAADASVVVPAAPAQLQLLPRSLCNLFSRIPGGRCIKPVSGAEPVSSFMLRANCR
jgi:hypothetical protein